MYWKNYCMSSFVSSKSSRYNFADEDIFCPYTFTEFRGIIHISFFISNTHATRIPSVNFSITLWNFCYSLRSLSYLPRLEHCYSCKLRKPLTNLPFTFCILNEDICITHLKTFIICFSSTGKFLPLTGILNHSWTFKKKLTWIHLSKRYISKASN